MTWLEDARFSGSTALEGLPPRFAEATFAQLPQIVVRDVVKDYLTQFWSVAPKGIAPVFLGPARSWKTFGAVVIARTVHANAGLGVEFVNCPRQLMKLDLHRYTELTRRTIRRWESVPFLVLDDFGVIEKGSFKADVLTALAANRFDMCRPTLWTANIDLVEGQEFDTIAMLYSPLLSRRLQDCSTGFVALTRTEEG